MNQFGFNQSMTLYTVISKFNCIHVQQTPLYCASLSKMDALSLFVGIGFIYLFEKRNQMRKEDDKMNQFGFNQSINAIILHCYFKT